MLLDATIPFEKQDLSIVDLIEQEGRALVIGVNKWDLVADQPGLLKELQEKATRLLPQVRGAPWCRLGAGRRRARPAHGGGAAKPTRSGTAASRRRSSTTGSRTRWRRNPPPAVSGRRIKIRYMTQAKARPPTFAIFGNQLDALPKSLYALPRQRPARGFDLPGVPIRVSLRTGEEPVRQGHEVRRDVVRRSREPCAFTASLHLTPIPASAASAPCRAGNRRSCRSRSRTAGRGGTMCGARSSGVLQGLRVLARHGGAAHAGAQRAGVDEH